MYCVNCGAVIDDDATFCTSCGAKVEGASPASGQQPQPTYPGQQVYAPMPPAYGQAGGGQPPYDGQGAGKPPRKKPGKGVWIGLAAALLVVILILVLFVYPGVLIGGSGGPLSGNTVQTRFFNDSAAVFTDAFSGLEDTALSEMMNEPFELSVDIDADMGYGTESASLDAAYDGKTFGLEAEGEGGDNILLLLEDTLYVMSYGNVEGIEFDTTEADLSESMALGERLKALLGSSGESGDGVDWKRLTETLVNSIDKGCFTKGSSETTLTMDVDDLTAMLETFSDKLQADDDLRKSLEDFLEDMTGESVDIEDAIDDAVKMIEAADLSLEWVVSYDKSKPVAMELTIEIAGQKIRAAFGYETSGDAVEITFEIKAPDGSKIKGSFSYERTKDGLEFNGEISADGQTLEFEGSMTRSKDDISGTLEITSSGQTATIDYDGTLSIGEPKKDVEDMFDIDTEDAYVETFSDLLGMLGYYVPDMGDDISGLVPDDEVVWDEPTESAESAVTVETSAEAIDVHSLDGTFWISPGYYTSDGLYYTGASMYFYGGMVYFGDEECTPEDCLAYSLSPYDVYYTFDGYTVTLSADGISETQEFYLIDDYTMVGSEGTYFYRQ